MSGIVVVHITLHAGPQFLKRRRCVRIAIEVRLGHSAELCKTYICGGRVRNYNMHWYTINTPQQYVYTFGFASGAAEDGMGCAARSDFEQ
jgi:hypothetical protein